MLPEKLSNNLCSLKPGEDRLAFVAEIHFNKEGEQQKASFYEAVIHSHSRLNYGEAQEIIEKQEQGQNSTSFLTPVKKKYTFRGKVSPNANL